MAACSGSPDQGTDSPLEKAQETAIANRAAIAEEDQEALAKEQASWQLSDEEWQQRLTPEQFEVTRRAGTERAFTGSYWDTETPGEYVCVGCGLDLFPSSTKYHSGTGWPSFWEPSSETAVSLHEDRGLWSVRTEVRCSRCGAHLGHVFEDGPEPTGLRYCLNSASLRLQPSVLGD